MDFWSCNIRTILGNSIPGLQQAENIMRKKAQEGLESNVTKYRRTLICIMKNHLKSSIRKMNYYLETNMALDLEDIIMMSGETLATTI